jgi:DNA-binding response OmpR family regulator/anti-sigma regulatory factor (Ser/Thr protein kinase)
MANIVIIDDETYILNSLKEILEIDDHVVTSFSNGWNALSHIKEEKVDLIICDIEMPQIRGSEILEKVKSDLETATIPFIFLSGLNKDYQIREGLILGADDYLTKPFEADTLLKTVTTRLEKSKKFEQVVNSKISDLRLHLSSVLPHEILTPLNGIFGPIQMLMENLEDFNNEEIKELHRVIFFCANRLKSVASNFLYFVEIEGKITDKTREDFIISNSQEVITRTINEISRQVGREDDIVFDLNNYNHNIEFKDFKKLFIEIVGNALKFSTKGNEVTIKSIENGDFIDYCVTDSGKGMTKDEIDRIDAYNQFNRNQFEQQGLGLGLYLVNRICTYYELKLDIKSEVDNGTQVIISLPKV